MDCKVIVMGKVWKMLLFPIFLNSSLHYHKITWLITLKKGWAWHKCFWCLLCLFSRISRTWPTSNFRQNKTKHCLKTRKLNSCKKREEGNKNDMVKAGVKVMDLVKVMDVVKVMEQWNKHKNSRQTTNWIFIKEGLNVLVF